MTSDGALYNQSSIGSPFATLTTQAGGIFNRQGVIEVLAYMTPTSVTDFDSAADADHDGTSNLMEYLAGTNPNSAASVFRPQGAYAGGLYRMPIPTVFGRIYEIWASRDLRNWTLQRTFGGDNTVKLFVFDETTITSGPLFSPIRPSTCFFRIQISAMDSDPAADDDQDGSSNWMEYLAGTDPNSASSVLRPQGSYVSGVFKMPIPTVSGRNYEIWVSRDLQNWTRQSVLSGDNTVKVFEFDETTITSGPLYSNRHPSTYFFRIQILIP